MITIIRPSIPKTMPPQRNAFHKLNKLFLYNLLSTVFKIIITVQLVNKPVKVKIVLVS